MNEDTPSIRIFEAFMRETGGTVDYEMATKHYQDGWTIQAIVELFGNEFSRSAVHRRVNKVWQKLERNGLLPDNWHRQPTGGKRKYKLHGTGKEVWQARIDRRRNGQYTV